MRHKIFTNSNEFGWYKNIYFVRHVFTHSYMEHFSILYQNICKEHIIQTVSLLKFTYSYSSEI